MSPIRAPRDAKWCQEWCQNGGGRQKWSSILSIPRQKTGEPGGIRTHDQWIKSPLHCRCATGSLGLRWSLRSYYGGALERQCPAPKLPPPRLMR